MYVDGPPWPSFSSSPLLSLPFLLTFIYPLILRRKDFCVFPPFSLSSFFHQSSLRDSLHSFSNCCVLSIHSKPQVHICYRSTYHHHRPSHSRRTAELHRSPHNITPDYQSLLVISFLLPWANWFCRSRREIDFRSLSKTTILLLHRQRKSLAKPITGI